MTEEEFYQAKIFNKASLFKLKRDFPHLKNYIDSWYCSPRYKGIQHCKTVLTNKLQQMTEDETIVSFSNEQIYQFVKWWEETPKICYYCSLPETDLKTLHNQLGHVNKRFPKRGQSLEIDRKQSHLPYTAIENLVLACYWCNNAKTDTFTESEFIKIGKEIKGIWEQRLNKTF